MQLSTKSYPNVLKEYGYWTLVLHERQLPHVGRCFAWWKDREPHEGEGLAPPSLPTAALVELHNTIYLDVEKACGALGHQITRPNTVGPETFRLNLACLANGLDHGNHMHWHFIPRFKNPLVLPKLGIVAEDHLWGSHYESSLAKHRALNDDAMFEVKRIIIEAIG